MAAACEPLIRALLAARQAVRLDSEGDGAAAADLYAACVSELHVLESQLPVDLADMLREQACPIRLLSS
jgi:hypothetical protein